MVVFAKLDLARKFRRSVRGGALTSLPIVWPLDSWCLTSPIDLSSVGANIAQATHYLFLEGGEDHPSSAFAAAHRSTAV